MNVYFEELKRNKESKIDQVKKVLIKHSEKFDGNWFSNKKARIDVIMEVDNLTDATLNRYMRMFRDEGFMTEISEEGRGWYRVNYEKS